MFAEDVELIPEGCVTAKLNDLRGHPNHAEPILRALWQTIDTGGFSTVPSIDLKRFNRGLFKDATVLSLNRLQLGLLIEAARHNWRVALGDCYREVIRAACPKVLVSAEFLMFWWEKAALAARANARMSMIWSFTSGPRHATLSHA